MKYSSAQIRCLRAIGEQVLAEHGYLRRGKPDATPAAKAKTCAQISTGRSPRCVICGALLSSGNQGVQCFACAREHVIGEKSGALKKLIAACVKAQEARSERAAHHRAIDNEQPREDPGKDKGDE